MCLRAGVVIARCASLMAFIILFKWSLLQQGEGRCNIYSCCVPQVLLFGVFMELVFPGGWLLEAAVWLELMVMCWGCSCSQSAAHHGLLCCAEGGLSPLGFCPLGAPLQPCSLSKSAGRNLWLQQVLALARLLSARIFAFCCSVLLEQISPHHLHY